MNRRGILGMVLGGGAAAASGVKPSQVLAAGGINPSQVLVPPPDTPYPSPIGYAGEWTPLRDQRKRVRFALERSMDQRARSERHLPAHIAAKRSWGLAFKQSEWAREEREYRAAVEALEDDTVVERVAKLLRLGT